MIGSMIEGNGERPLTAQYDEIWEKAEAAFAANAVSLDGHLLDKAQDRRRGATLLIRPSAAVAGSIAEVLAEIAASEPRQYYYGPQELHVTVLSLFTGTEQPQPFFAELPRYREAIDGILAATPYFTIRFDGLTASPAAVLVQGFPEDRTLHDLREALRTAIHAIGLGQNLDRRYRISTAHMTAARFCRPLRDPAGLAGLLRSRRRYDFGVSRVEAIELVQNDWYMSHDRVVPLHTYALR
jgi:2'-5' RNA ligase